MISVSERTKEAFINGGTKHLILHLIKVKDDDYKSPRKKEAIDYDIVIPEENIVADSMSLTQELISSGELVISGCIASKFGIEIYDLKTINKGNPVTPSDCYFIKASMSIDDEKGNTGDVIPLFFGSITKADNPSNFDRTIIEAHDDFYTMQNLESTSLGSIITNSELKRTTNGESTLYPCTLKQFMNPIFQWLICDGVYGDGRNHCSILDGGIADMDLPLNESTVDLTLPRPNYDNTTMTPLDFIRSYCETNGMLGFIDGEGVFKLYNLKDICPEHFWSWGYGQEINFYKNVYVNPDLSGTQIFSTTIYNADGDVIYIDLAPDLNGTIIEEGRYEINNSCFTDVLIKQVVKGVPSMMEIFDKAFGGNETLMGYNITTIGMPWVEVGIDAIMFYVISYADVLGKHELRKFRVFNRKLSGIQNLTDNFYYSATISTNKKRSNIQNRLLMLEASRPVARYVTETPTTFANNTLYFVRKS